MEVVIFVDEEEKIKEFGIEILDKLRYVGICSVRDHGKEFVFPHKNIRIRILDSDFEKIRGIVPRYILVDGDFDYDFIKYIKCLVEGGSVYLRNVKDIIMKVIEFDLYGDEEESED